ncbi:hypothetical protein NHX12_008632 [Muraenolepis orangiensis]|uniref:Calponin-homology (CH) domain-containing protein n=1 Tax=Muraenolepis orangiensis TaxID=630683 RepID=A0A9Q0IAD5_9TELE|nr:hypothetical protein NHX12_008632 [Muraenolepis orangiensis]
MAASVLLGSVESTGPGFSAPGSVLVGSNGGSAAPASSWNRSLDRALDEASATGCLSLSGRKLKEFPRSAANHDLTDTTRADLSRNRFAEVPPEVCLFVSLESLTLYHNCLRSVPDSLVNLQALTYLNISRNQLCVLPAVVCSLPLKVLIACNNKLDVSCNEIQVLPSQVGQLETLRDLNIRRNHLQQLSMLPLVRLDFSCNKVTSIPSCYRRLAHLHVIILDHNPLHSPPAHPVEENSEEQRHRRLGPPGPNGSVESEQIEFIDGCQEEDDEGRGGADGISLSSQFMAYIERRSTTEGSPGKASTHREELRRHNRSVVDPSRPPTTGGGVERIRREAQLAAQRYEEERSRSHAPPRDSAPAKHKSAPSPTKPGPGDRETMYPSRRSTHTDDSALFMQGEERAALSSTANQSPSHPAAGGVAPCRAASHRPESFLYRLSQREDKRKEEAQQVEQLRKNIEARLKVSLPSDLGAALTDGVVLCHLANHVRPRSVSSIHVPSPAVPKLTMAKCRRNVENFLEACRRIGLCLPLHVLEERGLPLVAGTVSALLELAPPRPNPASPMATSPLTL